MDQESNPIAISNIVFNYPKKPSKKSLIIGIPMFAYRIQTNDFSIGLNFFQKAVLKFKSRPGISNDKIADYLGIDVRLVSAIENELVIKKLIDKNGALTELGKTQRASLDGLIINGSKKKIGYVFRYLNEDKFYPFYVSSYRCPNVTSDPAPQIYGLKGDDFKYTVLYAKEMLSDIMNTLRPDEKKVLELIRYNNCRNNDNELDYELPDAEKKLSVKYIPDDRPFLVWICTYVYLEEKGDDIYSSDWKVLDPFSEEKEDSTSMKLYIQLHAPELAKKIDENFSDVQTIEQEIFKEAHFHMEKQVEALILKDFPLPQRVEMKFYSYLRTIVRTKLAQEYYNYSEEAPAREFAQAFQDLFESLLKKHREKFPKEYASMLEEFSASANKDEIIRERKRVLKEIFKFLFTKEVPNKIYTSAGGNLENPPSLRGYIVGTILTRMYSDQFYKLVLMYHQNMNELCEIRNVRGHGHTDKERVVELLTKEQVDNLYNFLKSFIYEYTNF